MLEDYEEQHRKRLSRMRSIMDFIMGTLLFLIGLYFLTYDQFNMNVFNRKPSTIDYFIGGLFIAYGVWRVYRGYKKDYFT